MSVMRKFLVLAVGSLLLAGCASQGDLSEEPTKADKAWHNCITVLTESPTPFTDDSITPETVCENQRETWQDFDSKWIVEIDRLIDQYNVDRASVSVYGS